MSSNIFQDILNKINEDLNITEKQLSDILAFLNNKKGKYIYFHNFQKIYNFDDKEISIIFGALVFYGIMVMKFKQFCPHCNVLLDRTFDSVEDLLGSEECSKCHEALIDDDKPFKYIHVNFKVK